MKVFRIEGLFNNLKLVLWVCILTVFLLAAVDLRADDPPVPLPNGQAYGTEVKADNDLSKTNSTTHFIIGIGAIILVVITGYSINRYYHHTQHQPE